MSQPNPYQSPAIPPEVSDVNRTQSAVRATFWCGITLVIMGSLGIFGGLYGAAYWGLVLFDKNPIYPWSPDIHRTAVQTVFGSVLMLLQSLLMVAGSVSLLQYKRRWLALIGAWAGILPMCGCYLISLIAGIWILVVLRRPEVKALFAANQPSGSSS
ncbi:MAG: hypothetical protein ACR2FY_26250 [Pirellulaceae bacterium]